MCIKLTLVNVLYIQCRIKQGLHFHSRASGNTKKTGKLSPGFTIKTFGNIIHH